MSASRVAPPTHPNNVTTVIWIDWYSYHVSRFRALLDHEGLRGNVTGIELIGGCGVHPGLKFRDTDRGHLPIASLFPNADWASAGQYRMARAVWRKLQEIRPSAVLVPGYYTLPALAAALWAKLHRRRSILMSETTAADYRRSWWREKIKRVLIAALFDCGIAGGSPHVRYLRELGLPPERIARCYDVVDNHFFEHHSDALRAVPGLRDRLGLPPEYFLYIGRLAPEKNVSGLLRAFAECRKSGSRWQLLLVGEGPDRRRLEGLCSSLNIAAQVRFTGLKTTAELIPYYAFATCFVLPSVREPWGLVVNEAMAAGLPVIVSSRCGCAEDLVSHRENGYVFDPAVTGQLAGFLTTISLRNPRSLAAMGRRSREIIANYSPEHWAAEVARLVQ